MIKTRGRTAAGVPVLTFGLSHHDLDQLALGRPMVFNLSELNLAETHVVLIGGESETSIATALQVAGLLPPGMVEKYLHEKKEHPDANPANMDAE